MQLQCSAPSVIHDAHFWTLIVIQLRISSMPTMIFLWSSLLHLSFSIVSSHVLILQPSIAHNFPDPSIYYENATKIWYALATNPTAGILNQSEGFLNDSAINVQLATSKEFGKWQVASQETAQPLPTLGDWAIGSAAHSQTEAIHAAVWSPDVIFNPRADQYLLYYSAAAAMAPHRHCFGAAVSKTLNGKFRALSSSIACPQSLGGAIDPSPFLDTSTGALYVVYKIDGNCIGNGGTCGNSIAPQVSTPLILQRMFADGTTPDPSWPALELLDRSDVYGDGPLIEAPNIVKAGNRYYLFFSSGCTRDDSYDIKYAYANEIVGPWTRATDSLLSTGSFGLKAPGSPSVVYVGAQAEMDSERIGGLTGWRMVFHARVDSAHGEIRAMFSTGLVFDSKTGIVVIDQTATFS